VDGNVRDNDHNSNKQANITGVDGDNDDDDEDEESCEQPYRSHRSSSFESDNLNVTTNELDDDESDEEGDIIVKIDNEDISSNHGGKLDNQPNGNEQLRISGAEVRSDSISQAIDSNGQDCPSADRQADGSSNSVVGDTRTTKYTDYPPPGYQCQYNQMPPNNCAFKEAYVHKMVKVNDDDRWSLISLGVQQSETNSAHQQQQASTNCDQELASSVPVDPTNPTWYDKSKTNQQGDGHLGDQQKQFPNSIELKFVDKMRRKFEFSVDSFQIILDSLIQFYDYAPQSTITIQRTTPVDKNQTPLVTNPLMNFGRCLQCKREQAAIGNLEKCSAQQNVGIELH